MRKIFVTGIGTNVGKTIVSAILVEALKADYWKPIQAGTSYPTDTNLVKELISNTQSIIHPEAYCLKEPLSPHAAAQLEGVSIQLEKIALPPTSNKTIIIEGAGGLMVPLNEEHLMLDLIQRLDVEVIIVIQNYLGSINHSLLTIDTLKRNNITVLGLIFNGETNPSSEEFILKYSKLKLLGRVGKEKRMDKNIILRYAKGFEFLKEYNIHI